jgi:hypothetical protein
LSLGAFPCVTGKYDPYEETIRQALCRIAS